MEYLLLIYHSEAGWGKVSPGTRRPFTGNMGNSEKSSRERASSWEGAS